MVVRKNDETATEFLTQFKRMTKQQKAIIGERYKNREIISEKRFKKLAPPEMHQFYKHFDHLYREWLGREMNGSHADFAGRMVQAGQRGEDMTVFAGDPQPIVEIIASTPFGERKVNDIRVMPLDRRVQSDPMDINWKDGKPIARWMKLEPEETPTFIFCMVDLTKSGDNFVRRMTFTCPLKYLFAIRHKQYEQPSLKAGCVYMHSFSDGLYDFQSDQKETHAFYYGMTTRTWRARWAEHKRSITQDSKLKFHRAFRDALRAGYAMDIQHDILFLSDNPSEVEDLEESMIANVLDAHPKCLNMIPGGKAGLAYLRAHGMFGRKAPTFETREVVLEAWVRENPRKGIPAPWVAQNWQNDDYAARVITGAEGRLSVEQVHAIRQMHAAGLSEEELLNKSGARNVEQVRRVISGKSYMRIK